MKLKKKYGAATPYVNSPLPQGDTTGNYTASFSILVILCSHILATAGTKSDIFHNNT